MQLVLFGASNGYYEASVGQSRLHTLVETDYLQVGLGKATSGQGKQDVGTFTRQLGINYAAVSWHRDSTIKRCAKRSGDDSEDVSAEC